MDHQSQSPLTHLVPPECLSGGPNDPPPTFPRAVTQSLGSTSPGGHKRPRSEDAQADDSEPLAKRERSSGPALDADAVGLGQSAGDASRPQTPPPAESPRPCTLPNSQDIGKDSPYRSWRDASKRSSSTPPSSPVPVKAAEPIDMVFYLNLFGIGGSDEEPSRSDSESDSSSSDATDDDAAMDEDKSDLQDINAEDFMDELETILDEYDDSKLLLNAFKPTPERASTEVQPRVWKRPGYTRLRQKWTRLQMCWAAMQTTSTPRAMNVVKTKRDHSPDRASLRKELLCFNAELWKSESPTITHNDRVAAQRRATERLYNVDSFAEYDVFETRRSWQRCGRGSPGKRGVAKYLDAPRSKYTYVVKQANQPGKAVPNSAFRGASRWASLATPAGQPTPGPGRAKLLEYKLTGARQHILMREDVDAQSAVVLTDRRAMKYWKEHKRALKILEHKPHAFMILNSTSEILQDEAVEGALATALGYW